MKHIGFPNNDKAVYLERVRRHRAADELVRGMGWDGFRGCLIGCTLEEYDHAKYAELIGVCEKTAVLIDWLFENLPENHVALPERVLQAIKPGADLSRIYSDWQIRLQTRNLARISAGEEDWKIACRNGIRSVISMFAGQNDPSDAAMAAAEAARVAAAWSVARASAAWSVESAMSASWSAAWSAAESAMAAAEAAKSSAAWSVAAAEIVQQANDLIELLELAGKR